MSDRRPENDELREAIEQHDEGVAGTHQYDEIVPIARMWLNDPVSLVRRGVESGTIKGEEAESLGLWWTSKLTRELALADDAEEAEVFVIDVGKPGTYLVIPVDVGEDR